ncbi:MAG TPA: riboflavin biosynthesis protein RibF [Nitrospiraceae bacterium]|jgi:riboflavin kinase/FMN adenylyltransferase|nr:riboflavin biosynthesis protein RibF [Nitrospiraceae bacterium]
MVVIRGLESLKKKYRDVVLTIGNFDGVHRGHQKIFRNVVERARALNGTAMAITFDPHPAHVLAPERGSRMLTTFDAKARLLDFFGIDIVLCINFTKEFASTAPDDFIRDVIRDKIAAREVIVGHNYAFGKGKEGSTDLLRRRGKKYGFVVKVVRYARSFGHIVSSSRIRSLLNKGRVCEASRLLGRPYMIEGHVIKGAGRGGSLLNVPTANIATKNELIPKEGVYAVKVGYKGRILDGAANIGRNPTFGNAQISYEIHIFDFSEDIRSEDIRVYFIDRIRDEETFPDISTLKEAIMGDISRARDILKTKKYPKLI